MYLTETIRAHMQGERQTISENSDARNCWRWLIYLVEDQPDIAMTEQVGAVVHCQSLRNWVRT